LKHSKFYDIVGPRVLTEHHAVKAYWGEQL